MPFLFLHSTALLPPTMRCTTELCTHSLIFGTFVWTIASFLWILRGIGATVDALAADAKQWREDLIRANVRHCEMQHFKNTLWDHVLDHETLHQRKHRRPMHGSTSWHGSTSHMRHSMQDMSSMITAAHDNDNGFRGEDEEDMPRLERRTSGGL